MASNTETAEDGILAEEISGQAPSDGRPPQQRNAFTDLMSPKKPRNPNPHSTATNPELVPIPPASITNFSGRNGLGAYLPKPESLPSSDVLYYNSDFVAIYDLYPKSEVHTLLLTRDLEKALTHPLLALQDEKFLEEVRQEVSKLKRLVASELRHRFGSSSTAEQARRNAMETIDPTSGTELPPGRDWEKDVMAGIHAGPSMTHLHVHVLSRDMHREFMKHRKHYNSFNTDFFVQLDDFPLSDSEIQKKLDGRARWLAQGFECWRCGKNFKNKFQQLKAHLEVEFEAWKKE